MTPRRPILETRIPKVLRPLALLVTLAMVGLPVPPLRSQQQTGTGTDGNGDGDEVEKRLRRLEEKLDRILKELELEKGTADEDEIRYKSRSLGDWVLDLGDRDSEVQAEAINALATVGADSIPRVMRALRGKDWLRRTNAALTLLRIGSSVELGVREVRAITLLFDELKGRLPAEIAGQFGPQRFPPEVLVLLTKSLEHADAGVRRNIANALGGQAARLLRGAGTVKEAELEPEIRRTLETITTALIARLEDDSADVRRSAVQALAEFYPLAKVAIKPLEDLLGDGDSSVSAEAAFALCLVGTSDEPRLIQRLMGLLGSEDASIRSRAASALGTFGARARVAIPALVATFNSKDEEAAYRVAISLARIDPDHEAVPLEAVVSILIEAMNYRDSQIRLAAIEALGRLGPRAARAVDELEERAIPPGSPRRARTSARRTRGRAAGLRQRVSDEERKQAVESLKRIRGEAENETQGSRG